MFRIQRGHGMKGNWPSCDIYILGNIPSVEQLLKLLVLLSFSSRFQHTRASQVASVVKNLPANAGDIRDSNLIPGSGRSPEEVMATHISILARRIPMERGACWAAVQRATKSQT